MLTKYFICANRIITDASDRKMTVVDIIEDTVSISFPMVYSRFYVLWTLDKSEGENDTYVARVKFSLDGETLGEFDSTIGFQGTSSTRSILVVGGLVVPRPGTLLVTAEIPGTNVVAPVSYPIKITGAAAPI